MESKTASALTPTEILDYRDKLKAQKVSFDVQAQLRLEKARQVSARAAELLKQQFSAKRVVIFGSVVSPDLFHARSDIDLAVWGMKGRNYFRAVGVLQSLDPEFSIDLILYEDASARLQQVISDEGIDL
jgi:predicted nucleotidyltransferase